mgnify:CR=1 FL=1
MFSAQQAEDYISEMRDYALAKGREPGTWYMFHNHVYGVALLAKEIAALTKDLNPERAYVMGLMHDAGKMREDFEKRFHGIIGYELLKEEDFEAARASLLHMFGFDKFPPYEKVAKMFFDNHKDYDFVCDFAVRNPLNDYDRLIQMADAMADKRGLVTMEQRAADYAVRYHQPVSPEMFGSRMALKQYFDKKTGVDIYSLFEKISPDYKLQEGQDIK